MDKTIHLVIPKGYDTVLLSRFKEENFIVTNVDHELDNFRHWALSKEKENPKIAFIMETMENDLPVEIQAKEFVEKLTEIKVNRSSIRIVVVLPEHFDRILSLKKKLATLNIYDMYFDNSLSFQKVLSWIETEKTLADVKHLIIDGSEENYEMSPNEKKIRADVEEQEREDESYYVEDNEDNDGGVLSNRINEMFGDKLESIKRLTDSFSIDLSVLQRKKGKKVIEKYITMAQQSIVFISLSKGAGSTFHSLNFASYLQDKGMSVGLYEQPIHTDGRTYIADIFEMYKKKEDLSVPHAVLNRKPIFLDQLYTHNSIGVYATDYSKGYIDDFKNDQMIKYLNTGKHMIKIMDFGYVPTHWFNSESFVDILQLFDHIVVVTDLLPLNFIPNFERFSYFQEFQEALAHSTDVHFLLNRYESKVPKKELRQLNLQDANRCPQLDYDEIYKSYFDKKIPFDTSKEIQEELSITYKGLFDDMEIEIETKIKKKRGLLGLVGL